jgi:hypothetical protein
MMIMQDIFNFYKLSTLPITVLVLMAWIGFLVAALIKHIKVIDVQGAVIIIFLLGLFTAREMVLAIVSATSTVAGRNYESSCQIFLYILLFFLVQQLWVLINVRFIKRKTNLNM